MSAIAIITARGGSKRIPRKNIRPFRGMPIIGYSIKAAQEAGCFDEVMVSTDDREIAHVAMSFGARVPFMRSAQTSDDRATTADVLVEVLTEFSRTGRTFDVACCIYPTAPFVTAASLAEGFRILQDDPDLDSVLPVVRFSYPIQRAVKIENDRLTMIWPENLNARSQDLMPAYHDVGQFYWLRVPRFLKDRRLFSAHTAPLVMPEWMAQDIDDENDWIAAEAKFDVIQRLHLRDSHRRDMNPTKDIANHAGKHAHTTCL
jgi:N-acylneuraminate cytidylyltransferase